MSSNTETGIRILKTNTPTVGIVGLGYVGLPVALGFAKKYKVIGYDINNTRITSLKNHVDETKEVSESSLREAAIEFTIDPVKLEKCNVIIVTVPTPLNKYKEPELSHIIGASKTIGENLNKGTIVIYESTVFPGATEEICIPLLEHHSGLRSEVDFFVGYSPERINPGDKEHTFPTIEKVVAAQSKLALEEIYRLYQNVIDAKIHKASSIKVAEASKIVENTQRDINIAFMNELSIIFRNLGINTYEVLDAAKSKWNFLPFTPGLVGGHCIGVDPYYLIHKSKMEGYTPKFITTARYINDQMPTVIADFIVKYIDDRRQNHDLPRVGVLGITFKENVPDIRNSKAIEIIERLNNFGIEIYVHDPYVNEEVISAPIKLVDWNQLNQLDIIILAVPHHVYLNKDVEEFVQLFRNKQGLIMDIKGVLQQFNIPEGIEVISL
ncbi:UDP-N-acetyl-D-galactosamine dehydrogenase [Oceanobacillus limi]|uniref:UDP-N-acetyl-D-galactosamine dehydrogenase n=1 Tax=Oceanobacillus limi TaxID=930131 RepID=A0A1I0H0S2_9BACI|nr:nucleotide sugar dehydrogenase [Oceanobacillus limi]SET77132.1 UDP-N-acetyl-D-galactosamine dehydrogenase [Oceanobacillus limi]